MTGDVWIDDIRITPIEEEGVFISRSALTLMPKKTYQLTVANPWQAPMKV